MRSLLLGASLALGLGCSSPAPSRNAPPAQDGVVIGTYRLVAVGSQAPEYWSRQGGCDVPVFSIYTFNGGRWSNIDTIRSVGDCRVALPPDSVVARIGSGYYRRSRDTLNLFVDDTMIGLKGWIMRLLVHGDTLVFRKGEFDPGDYVYVRPRS